MNECPNCLSELQQQIEDGYWICPVCQFATRACPDCSSTMVKRVEAPEGLSIEKDGLPIEQCVVYWICQSDECGSRIETEL